MLGMTHKATSGIAALLAIGLAGCVDLDVQNLNDADAARALRTAGDVEALIAGSYGTWDNVIDAGGPAPFLSNASGQHAAPWANFGMELYARIPRVPTNNIAGAASVGNLTRTWYQSYRAIAAVHDGLKQIDDGAVDLGANTVRAQAFGKFVQGLAHATVAILYDSGFVYDETLDALTITLKPYTEVMAAARGYFDDAITLASGTSFSTPSSWFGGTVVTSAELIKVAHSWKAAFYAAMARTPTERQALDWNSIRTDAQAGFIDKDWGHYNCATGSSVCQEALYYMAADYGWSMQNNWVLGMTDQSGGYQAWINTPLLEKMPFLYITPDTRWPQGATEAEQEANPGEYYSINPDLGSIWLRPDRGTWRWSYYFSSYPPFYPQFFEEGEGFFPAIRATEMKALVAEADFYGGNLGAVATFVNATRTAHGLNATSAAGLNTSCVPKLPNGACGNLWEMFKWEKRVETQFTGPMRIGFYFDSRGWGDLMAGTILQFPVPYGEMQLLEQKPYNFGGVGGVFGAPLGSYGY